MVSQQVLTLARRDGYDLTDRTGLPEKKARSVVNGIEWDDKVEEVAGSPFGKGLRVRCTQVFGASDRKSVV